MLVFMPWCPIDKAYKLGDVTITPFERHQPIDDLHDDAAHCRINTIMATYKDIEGKPVYKAAIVRYGSKSPIDELTDDEIETAQDLAVLACFCGLAKREYFKSLPYCNSDCFSLHTQKFDKADFTALMVRRRDGRTRSGWPIDDIWITVPMHCHTIEQVSLDKELLEGLVNHRCQTNNGEWGRWQNAISCFNQANTDSDNIRYQTEWVLLCSAFERLLSEWKADAVACRFAKDFVPSEDLWAKDAKRFLTQQKNDREPIRYQWMQKFCTIRGEFAHGNLNTRQPTTWDTLEHLVLATIAFPLLVKSLLNKTGQYKLTTDDQAQIDVFERFADTPGFLRPPPDQKNSLDSHWKRLVEDRSMEIDVENACNQSWNRLTPEQRRCLEGNPNEKMVREDQSSYGKDRP